MIGVHFKFWIYHLQPLVGGGGGNPERCQKVLLTKQHVPNNFDYYYSFKIKVGGG